MQHITIEYQTPQQVYNRGKQLVGMTFRDVLELGIVPEGVTREYNSRRYKGGMGTLIEERFFGYKANSDREADFAEAGVELKATCIDRRKNGKDAAGERLVLTMIPTTRRPPRPCTTRTSGTSARGCCLYGIDVTRQSTPTTNA